MTLFTDNETRNYYDSYSDIYALIWSEQMHTGYYDSTTKDLQQACEEMNKHLAEIAAITEGSIVLSVGCGRGGSDRFLAKNYKAKVIGVDISEHQLEQAQVNANKFNLSIKYQIGSMTQLPINDSSVDYLWVQEALFHCHEKEKTIKEFYRVLKPGGRVIIEDTVLLDKKAHDEVMASFGNRVFINTILTPEEHLRIFIDTGFKSIISEDLTEHLAQTYKDIAAYVVSNRESLKQKIDKKYWSTLESDTGRVHTLDLVERKKMGCFAMVFEK